VKVFFRAAALAVVLSACQRAPAAMAPEPVPAGEAPRPDGSGGASAPPAAQPLAPPGQAYQLGWMPLVSTNVPAFLSAHPEWNGHGVLIAVLDGGVEPVPGLDRLPDGSPKILDIRDFSGEGRIVLSPVIPSGDSVRVGGAVLGGAGRIRVLHTDGPIYGGELREFDLGQLPAADINGNGRLGDILPVLVVRLSDGWAVLTDSDGDGSLAGERPIRDYARGGEFLAWSGKARPAPLSVAVNLADGGPAQPPALDLVFDTSGHGTHVAGIAAGNALYGVPGFNGVAPGASLLALKIANDARGGITVTGSMVQAVDYAIRYAGARRMPLVINLSYGVGNEGEGRARIDGMLDSVLAAHPEVVMTISAGNDGPGISTLGFPASATRAIAVGATYPGAFLPLQPNGRRFDDQVAFFSARGGELARPDLLAPGMAYSTVPPWDVGEEVKNGTSMAAPHVAGLAALLLSGLSASDSPWDGGTIRRALMASARTLPGATVLDQGAGLVDVYRAWTLLSDGSQGRHPDIVVSTAPGTSAVLIGPRDSLPVDTVVTFTLSSTGSDKGGASSEISYRLRPDVPWLKAPATVRIGNRPVEVGVRIAAAPALPGAHVGVVEGWGPDSTLGPAFRLVATLAVSRPPPADSSQLSFRLAAGTLRRTFIRADSGRGFEVEVSEPRGAPLLAFLWHALAGRRGRDGHCARLRGGLLGRRSRCCPGDL